MSTRFPWPPKTLSPNARVHWATRSRAAKRYRQDCFYLAKCAGLKMPGSAGILSLTFCPPDRRKRDDDNLVAAFKAGRDGIAQAMGIDDHRLSLLVKMGEPVEGGAVIVDILEDMSM